ncbi:MAG: hypothetical protein OXU20_26100 [Myxococcales bacterium]|nr:hypothetical protein [Myxococcales bacterium]
MAKQSEAQHASTNAPSMVVMSLPLACLGRTRGHRCDAIGPPAGPLAWVLGIGLVVLGVPSSGCAPEVSVDATGRVTPRVDGLVSSVIRRETGPRLRGWMREFRLGEYEIRSVDVEAYLTGSMGARGEPLELALSYLPARHDSSSVQRFTGFYRGVAVDGAYRRSDKLVWTEPHDGSTIHVRNAFRTRHDGRSQTWGIVGQSMDFNLGGHGRGPGVDPRVCFGPFDRAAGVASPCTRASGPNDSWVLSHPTARRRMNLPVYDFEDDPDYWSFLVRDFPCKPGDRHPQYHERALQFSAYLPVALTASGTRSSAGFVYNVNNDNGWHVFSTWILPPSSDSCTQTWNGEGYVRPRAFIVRNVLYADYTRGRRGNAINVQPIELLVLAVEHEGVGREWRQQGEIGPGFFRDTIVAQGGGTGIEVYWFYLHPAYGSMPLGGISRDSTECKSMPHPRDGAAHCHGHYDGVIDCPDDQPGTCGDGHCGRGESRATCPQDCLTQAVMQHFYYRRRDKARFRGEIEPADAAPYHMLPFGGDCNL